MASFFLRWEPFGSIDRTGEEFPTEAAAHETAKLVARELARNRDPGPTEHVAVVDEAGKVVSVVYLA